MTKTEYSFEIGIKEKIQDTYAKGKRVLMLCSMGDRNLKNICENLQSELEFEGGETLTIQDLDESSNFYKNNDQQKMKIYCCNALKADPGIFLKCEMWGIKCCFIKREKRFKSYKKYSKLLFDFYKYIKGDTIRKHL